MYFVRFSEVGLEEEHKGGGGRFKVEKLFNQILTSYVGDFSQRVSQTFDHFIHQTILCLNNHHLEFHMLQKLEVLNRERGRIGREE